MDLIGIIEDVSHLAPEQKEYPHHTQTGEHLYVKALFFVTDHNQENEPLRLLSVRIPKYTSIFRLREVLGQIEDSIREVYGEPMPAGVCLVRKEGENQWIARKKIPTLNVLYV